jgi:hypothetical protein
MESNRIKYKRELTSACIERMQNPDDASKLCVDAELLGYVVNRRNRAFDEGDIQKIAGTYRLWKLKRGSYNGGRCLPNGDRWGLFRIRHTMSGILALGSRSIKSDGTI